MEQHHGSHRKPIVLKYAKRRYDGGVEVGLIQYLESQQKTVRLTDAASLENLMKETASEDTTPSVTACNKKPETPEPTIEGAKRRKIFEALLMGPLQIAVGMAGILTAGLALVATLRYDNPTLAKQGKTVFTQCMKTFYQGLKDTALCPGKVLKLVVA